MLYEHISSLSDLPTNIIFKEKLLDRNSTKQYIYLYINKSLL